MPFGRSSTQYVPFKERHDADGTVWIQAYAAAGSVAKTPTELLENEYGYNASVLADNTHTAYFGVPAVTVASGDVGWYQIGGVCKNMITASLSMTIGHAIKIHDGACADVGADYSGASSEFAIAIATSTSATKQDVMLIPRRITATT